VFLTASLFSQKLSVMKSERLPKILLTAFISALAIYILAFSLIQYRRTFRGPWQVVFLTDFDGTPGVLVEQRKLKISERIMFPNQKLPKSNSVHAFVFDDPTRTNVPFGQVVFQDLTFLPGTVTLNMFGHEIEFLPRVLIVDKQEHLWKTGEVISISGPGNFKPHPPK
jgi:hypothetical protein